MAELSDEEIVLCSECFTDEGLRFGALMRGASVDGACPNCGREQGRKLSRAAAAELAWQFFTWGSMLRVDYGAAPLIVANDRRKSDVVLARWSGNDLHLFEKALGLGFFHYGPRLWMLGRVTPLEELQQESTRQAIIDRILAEYPKRLLGPEEKIYRLRKGVKDPVVETEYDPPPDALLGEGRLESPDLPILYGSLDLETCVHECRMTVLDEAFVATLEPVETLHLLDLTHLLIEEQVSEFESLDIAMHMLFLAAEHSYPISREIAKRAREQNLDGILYPSFFSLARTGTVPFQTMLGISIRRLEHFAPLVQRQTVPNVALFGRPIAEGKIRIRCINRLILGGVRYNLVLGPTGFE